MTMYQAHQGHREIPQFYSDNIAENGFKFYSVSTLDLNPYADVTSSADLPDNMTIGGTSNSGPGSEPASTEGTTNNGVRVTTPSADDGHGNNEESVVDVSTTFFPGMISHEPADIILISSDNVQFHVHLHVLYDASGNGFASLLSTLSSTRQEPGIPILTIPEKSDILNVLLLTIYSKPIADYRPMFNILVAAVHKLKEYGIQPERYVKPGQPLFELIRFHMPLHPLDVYVLAAHYDLFELAVAASSHLLSARLDTITDEQSMRMGAVYLKRLYGLHSRRIDALKNILIRPPEPHPSTSTCCLSDQTGVSRAWALSAAYLIWDARPDMSLRYIESTMGALKQHVSCEDCKESIDAQVRQCVADWSSVKWSI